MFKLVLFVIFFVLCVVNTQSDVGCQHSRSYTRVKRGRYPGVPIRFYSRPPMTFPFKGLFSYTPPPFMQDEEAPYPGNRPYKVSKRPTKEGLGDDDISKIVKNLSKHDLDKILEFASEKDKYAFKNKDVDNEYYRPHQKENLPRPTDTKDFYNENVDTKYQEEKPHEIEFKKYINYVTEATSVRDVPQDERRNPYSMETKANRVSFYGPQTDGPPPFRNTDQDNAIRPFEGFGSQDYQPTQLKGLGTQDSYPHRHKPFIFQDDQPTTFKAHGLQEEQIRPTSLTDSLTNQNYLNSQELNVDQGSNNSDFTETNEEEKLPPPTNMREEDFDASYTNNVPAVVKADSDSYQVESFGDLPLMNYDSKMYSTSSYHVPHYTVTQSKSQSPPSQSYSSSTGLQPSPAAASIKAPPFEPAPPVSAAREQSDAHLKAIKIWSHKSKGAAYALHDDGTLTPEWPRPKYGK